MKRQLGPRKRPSLVTSIAVVAVAALLAAACVGCETEEHFFDVTGELVVLSAADHYDEAVEGARNWKADAALAVINAGIGAPNSVPAGPSLTFHFDSPRAASSFYELRLTGETWTSEVVEVGSDAAVRRPIERQDWSLDSVDAWSIALANGVEDFLLHYQDPATTMGLTLDYWTTNSGREVLAWRVNCFILYGPSLGMLIDPQSGEIIESEERSMSGTLVATTPTLPATAWAPLPACTPATPQAGRATGLPERIAFESSRDGTFHIYLMDPDGSNIVQLTEGPGADTGAAWSPDGRRIAFASRVQSTTDIYVMDSDGSNVARLTDHPANDDGPAWSPDGSRIAFSSDRDGNDNLYIIDANGSNLSLLTDHPSSDHSPDWSPDGCRILFVSNRHHWPESHVYVVNAEGSNVTQLTDGSTMDHEPRWSPDGTRIAFWSQPIGEAEAQPNVYVIDQDGSDKVRLTTGCRGGYRPVWSPDGARIVFSIGRDDPFGSDVFVMEADGTNVVQLTHDPDSNSPCSWR